MIETFRNYQYLALNTAIYPNLGDNIIYPTLGLCGEAGEFAEKIKKIIRDKNSNYTDKETVNELKKELGDVLWYIALIAYEIGVPLEDIAQGNIEKLNSRKLREVLHGNGDNR